jgi:hypothetical protein
MLDTRYHTLAGSAPIHHGERERLLLAAAQPGKAFRYVPPGDESKAAVAAHERAIDALVDLGFLETARGTALPRRIWLSYPSGDPRVWREHVRLTPMGAALVNVLRDELASGKTIRWPEMRNNRISQH